MVILAVGSLWIDLFSSFKNEIGGFKTFVNQYTILLHVHTRGGEGKVAHWSLYNAVQIYMTVKLVWYWTLRHSHRPYVYTECLPFRSVFKRTLNTVKTYMNVNPLSKKRNVDIRCTNLCKCQMSNINLTLLPYLLPCHNKICWILCIYIGLRKHKWHKSPTTILVHWMSTFYIDKGHLNTVKSYVNV